MCVCACVRVCVCVRMCVCDSAHRQKEDFLSFQMIPSVNKYDSYYWRLQAEHYWMVSHCGNIKIVYFAIILKYLAIKLKKENTKIYSLRKIRKYISFDVSVKIYKQTILPYFDYGGLLSISETERCFPSLSK